MQVLPSLNSRVQQHSLDSWPSASLLYTPAHEHYNLDDITHAFDVLDSSDSIPTICCEASSRIPPLSLDPVAEQVHSNSQALRALSSVIECLEKKLSSFLVSVVSSLVTSGVPPGVSYAAAASSDSSGDSHHPPVTSRKVCVSPRSSPSTDDRSCNVILFGLPEGRSLVESKMLVDEVLEFLSGKHIPIKDVFCLGKYVQPSASSHPRPILIKLCTAWDRKLVLLHKTSLKNFRIKSLFLREDMPPDHKLRSRKPKPLVESHSGDSSRLTLPVLLPNSALALRLSTLLLPTTVALCHLPLVIWPQ